MTYEIGKLSHETLLGPIAAAEDALARLDEKVARSEVGPGFAERADFFDSVSSMWIAGELVHLEESGSPRCENGCPGADPRARHRAPDCTGEASCFQE